MARGLRIGILGGAFAVLGALAVGAPFACSSASGSQASTDGAACNTDAVCGVGGVCVMDRCHRACRQSAECPLVQQRCVILGTAGGCLLDDELSCGGSVDAGGSSCRAPLVCAIDGQCRSVCSYDEQCGRGRICIAGGLCVEPYELSQGRLPERRPGGPGSGWALGDGASEAITDGTTDAITDVKSDVRSDL